MNKKGTTAIYYFMIGIIFFILGLALAPALTGTSNEAQTQLDCSNSSISNQDKSVCYQTDAMPSLYIGVLFGLGSMVVMRLIN